MTNESRMYGAIVRGDAAAVQDVLENDPAIAEVFVIGDTWLHRAAMSGHIEIMEALVNAGIPVDALREDGKGTPLESAAGQGMGKSCAWLLEHGANINHGLGESATPIFDAIYGQSLNLVKLFVERGANLDAVFGDPPIDVVSYAESYGTPEIVDFLRQAKQT